MRKLIRKTIKQLIKESQKTHLPSSGGDQSLSPGDFSWAGSEADAQTAFEKESEESRNLKKDFHEATGESGQAWFRDNTLMVHGSNSNGLDWFNSKIENGRTPTRREISVNAFLKEDLGSKSIVSWSSNPVLLIIKGHVSYAGLEDLRSSYYSKNYSKRPHTEYGADFMTGDDSSKKYFNSQSRGQMWDGYEEIEFIVANWTVAGVIVDLDTGDQALIVEAIKTAKENGYPVYDRLLRNLV